MKNYDATFELKKKWTKNGTKPFEHTSKHSEEENRPQQCKVKSNLFTTTGTKWSLIGQYTRREWTYYEKKNRPCQRGIKTNPFMLLAQSNLKWERKVENERERVIR